MPKTSIDATMQRLAPAAVPLDDQVGFLLRRAYQRAAANLVARIGGGLTAPQYAVLARLAECGPLTQNRLGRLVDMEPPTIHGVIRRLEARLLIETAPDPQDRRRTRVSLTPTGRTLAARLAPLADDADGASLSSLSPQERAMLRNLLRRLV